MTELSVAVESAIHDTLREIIQRIADEHEILVESISVDWVDVSTYAEPRFIINNFSAHTSSRRARPEPT